MSHFVVVISECTQICKIYSLLFHFEGQEIFSTICLRRLLLCSLNVSLFFAVELLNFDWWSLLEPSNFTSYACFCLLRFRFLQLLIKQFFDYFWEPNKPFSSFFSMLTVFCCSTSITAAVVLWFLSMEPNLACAPCWPCWYRNCVFDLRRLEIFWTFCDTQSGTWCSNQLPECHSWRKEPRKIMTFQWNKKIVDGKFAGN